MSKFRRYVPLVSVAYVCSIVIMRAWGLDALADQVASFGGLLGIDKASPVSAAELTAAAAAIAGVVLKIKSVLAKG